MKLKNSPQNVINAAVALLAPSCAELTPETLITALRTYRADERKVNQSTRLLSMPEVAAMLGVSRGTVWRWIRLKVLPAPIRIGPKSPRLLASAIEGIIAEAGGRQPHGGGPNMNTKNQLEERKVK